ncbi:MAG: hypothetical protein HYZ28_06960 [Myxococcales bacterium]|nr:hypothetical protein [Myxococcales bacterium]
MMELQDELRAVCARGDIREHLVEAAALIAEALRAAGIDPILVGGGAAQLHTAGAYVSGDIDFVAPGNPQPALEGLGFHRKGRHYVHPECGLWVEFPSAHLDPGESTVTVNVRGRKLRVVSVPDLLLDRLNGFRWGGAEIDGVTALMLLRLHPGLHTEELRRRAAEQRVLDALDQLSAEMRSPDSLDAIVRRVRQRLETP